MGSMDSDPRVRKCPRCNIRLSPIDMRGIVADRCLACNGVWFDAIEVETAVGSRRRVEAYVPKTHRKWQDSDLPCPACGGVMWRLLANPVFPFDIDTCPKDKGYWIDPGELEKIAEQVDRKTLRIKQPDAEIQAAEQAMAHTIAERHVAAIERRERHRERMEMARAAAPAEALEAMELDDLDGAQQVMCLFGLPAESGAFCEWRSWGNLLLIGVNVAVFVHMTVLGLAKEWFAAYAFVPAAVAAAPATLGWTVLTAMFLHAGFVHIFGNLFFLFTVGDDVEKRMGHTLYLLFYVTAGIVAEMISMVSGLAPKIPHLGASGAIAGVMGAFAVLCPQKRFYFWWLRYSLRGHVMAVGAWLYMAFWFGTQLLSLRFGNPGIDYWAHIGGFAFGVAVAYAVKALQAYNPALGQWQWNWRASARAPCA